MKDTIHIFLYSLLPVIIPTPKSLQPTREQRLAQEVEEAKETLFVATLDELNASIKKLTAERRLEWLISLDVNYSSEEVERNIFK